MKHLLANLLDKLIKQTEPNYHMLTLNKKLALLKIYKLRNYLKGSVK